MAGIVPTNDAPANGVLGLSESLSKGDAPVSAPTGADLPTGLEISLFVICAFAVLLALLGSSVWAELRAAKYR